MWAKKEQRSALLNRSKAPPQRRSVPSRSSSDRAGHDQPRRLKLGPRSRLIAPVGAAGRPHRAPDYFPRIAEQNRQTATPLPSFCTCMPTGLLKSREAPTAASRWDWMETALHHLLQDP